MLYSNPTMARQPDRDSTPADQALISIVMQRYSLAYRNQYQYWTDFDRYYKMYESYVNDSKSIWNTKIFIPLVFSYIERFLPKLVAKKPTVNFMPRRPDGVEKAQKMQALFDWQWDQIARIKEGGMAIELMKLAKEGLITGTAIAKIPWMLEMEDRKMFDEKGNVVIRSEKIFDGPSFEIIDPYDFFFDPEAYGIQNASWVMHRTRKTLDEMKAVNKAKGVEIYKNLDQLVPSSVPNIASGDYDFKLRRKIALGNSQMLVQDDTTEKVELWEMWGLFPKYGKDGEETGEYEKKVVTVANKGTVVRDIPYPYWHGQKPFIKFTPFPRNFEFYGVPIIKHIERMQFYTNEFVSQKFDNQSINLNQMIVVDPSANLEDWQLVWRPGGVIRAKPEYIKPLPLGDVTAPIDVSVNYLSTQMQLATGMSDFYSSGVSQKNSMMNYTATGANLINQNLADRTGIISMVFEGQVIKEIGRQWHGLDGQFVKIPMVVRVTGPDGKSAFPLILPDDLRANYDVVPEAGSSQQPNLEVQRQQFIQALQLIQGNPLMMNQTDWSAVEKELFTKFDIKNGDKLMIATAGSVPSQMPGGEQLPGQTGGISAPQSQADILNTAANGQPPSMPQGGQAPQMPGEEKPETKGKISTKFADLTTKEQDQYLRMIGIEPDTLTRVENMAQSHQQDQADRSLNMAKQFQNVQIPNIGE